MLAIASFALVKVVAHLLTNDGYGFHRDELATIDDAKNLTLGFVAYPPVTPFLGRVTMLFADVTPAAIRFVPSLAQAIVIVLAAQIARRLGGDSKAQWFTALAVAISPMSLGASALYQYVSFDFLWWVLIAWLVVRLAESRDARWWVPIGAVIGVGVLTKYTIVFYVAGIVVGFLATDLRRHIASRWLWFGVIVSIAVTLPHLWWQVRHDFITLDFLQSIHARDVRIGRTGGFYRDQLLVAANLVTVPLWATGLIALFTAKRFERFRIIAWMAVVPFGLFALANGRGYYMGPVYPMLLAAGAVIFVSWANRKGAMARRSMFAMAGLLLLVGSSAAIVTLPITPIGSRAFAFAQKENHDLVEEVGWPELVREVARIHRSLPAEERARTGVFCNNYGEAGAVNLYGTALGLPPAISGVNSYWLRTDPARIPSTLIVLGGNRNDLELYFSSVTLAGHTPVVHGVRNEETEDHPDIFVVRGFRGSWPEVWPKVRGFG
jgi:hypothetical protein